MVDVGAAGVLEGMSRLLRAGHQRQQDLAPIGADAPGGEHGLPFLSRTEDKLAGGGDISSNTWPRLNHSPVTRVRYLMRFVQFKTLRILG